MPTLPADNIAASYIYYDAQADDARLTLTVATTAADYGAAVVELRDARRPRRRTPTASVTGARVAADGNDDRRARHARS